MQPEGINSIPVVIDLMSLGLMKGESIQMNSAIDEEGTLISLQAPLWTTLPSLSDLRSA